MAPAYSTPAPLKPTKPRKRRHRPIKPEDGNANMRELAALRERCARQRKELEQLKAIVTVASTSPVENVVIVKDTGAKADE